MRRRELDTLLQYSGPRQAMGTGSATCSRHTEWGGGGGAVGMVHKTGAGTAAHNLMHVYAHVHTRSFLKLLALEVPFSQS